jgi:hypothetical protein
VTRVLPLLTWSHGWGAPVCLVPVPRETGHPKLILWYSNPTSKLSPPLEYAVIREHPMPGNRLAYVEKWQGYDSEVELVNDLDEANIVTSLVMHPEGLPTHRPALDLDMPVKVLPSSTPGHHHLYIDHKMTWDEYKDLLKVMTRVGLLEPGYTNACLSHGYTTLRLPWIKK